MGSLSNNTENAVLNLLFKNTAYTTTAPVYLALTTVAVGETDTGSTITEANWTGYARKQFATADWNSASGGSITTNVLEQFANTTAGSSVVIGYAFCSAASGGEVIVYGTVTSVTINTSQQPAQVASGGVSVSAD